MTEPRDLVGEKVRAACAPSRTEIIRSKKAMSRVLADNRPHQASRLVWALLEEEGLSPTASDPDVTFDASTGIEPALAADPPSVIRARLAGAGYIALAELEIDGLVVRSTASVREEAGSFGGHVRVSRVHGSGAQSSGIPVGPELELGRVYQRSSMAIEAGPAADLFSADLFTADLAELGLASETVAILRESIGSYRRRLFRASAVLLGIVVEGAWYAAAEKVKHLSAELEKALGEDLATAKVQKRLVDLLRTARGFGKAPPDELHSHAALMRALRNYGVHPRPGQTDQDLERFFNEQACGLLLLNTHHHLKRLAECAFELLRQTCG